MFTLGGRRGIRTPGSSHFNGFQDRRNRPLCHPSLFNSLSFLSLSRGYRSKAQRFDEIAPVASDFYSVAPLLTRHATRPLCHPSLFNSLATVQCRRFAYFDKIRQQLTKILYATKKIPSSPSYCNTEKFFTRTARNAKLTS